MNEVLLMLFLMNSANASQMPNVKMSEGVILRGCGVGSAQLENTNNFPVRIRTVRQGSGEVTESIETLQRESKKKINRIDNNRGFYIYDMKGVMIGWLDGKCSQK
jgi:hypothetical protein